VRVILKEAEGKLNVIRGLKPEPFQVLCTDFTEIRYAGGTRKAYLMAMIDPGSGWAAGWAVGKSANRELALKCWELAKANLAAWGVRPQGLIVHHDQDTVYTSYRWLRQLLIQDKVVVSYCERGAKDNPWMESFWAHFKGENVLLFLDAATFEELEWVVGRQMGYYNNGRRHSRLGYRPPVEYLKSEGFIPETLAEKEAKSGSATGAQATEDEMFAMSSPSSLSLTMAVEHRLVQLQFPGEPEGFQLFHRPVIDGLPEDAEDSLHGGEALRDILADAEGGYPLDEQVEQVGHHVQGDTQLPQVGPRELAEPVLKRA
jgi:putative transposase